ncbi:MAG: hypothetical protein VXY28_02095, partial [Bacteroidota bacterium]|nr:hypothetical protein [Bacteroidota bacterium]
MEFWKRFFFIYGFIFLSLIGYSSHVPGGNISYECLGNNQYVITLTLFEDCGTAFIQNAPENIMVTNTCGIFFQSNLQLPIVTYREEVSQLCPQMISQSECNGGSLPGVYKHTYRDTITLPANCDSWVFAFDDCCRNASNNLNGTGNSYYWESVLNSNSSPCNSSPVINANPIPYNCVNQSVRYNFGVVEPDGDSLSYSLIPAKTSSTGIVSYQAGFSGTTPITGIQINPISGEITFFPTQIGNYVIAVLIKEYDSNGNFIGSVIQDFQFEIINCNNNNPTLPPGGIGNLSGDGVQTNSYEIQACEGDSVCFDITFADDISDSVYINSNVSQIFPGAVMTQNTYTNGFATASFCLIITPNSSSFSTITVNAKDNACPIVGVSSVSVVINVLKSTYAGLDKIMCEGIGTTLNVTGGTQFNWSSISGDPITIGNNFSCNNCANPIANPDTTTSYQVTSNLIGNCTNVDTVVVNVVPDFNYVLTQSSTSNCINSSIYFNVEPVDSVHNISTYNFNWEPANLLNNPNINNPTFEPVYSGNFDFEVTTTNQFGCEKKDTLNVTILPYSNPSVNITANDSSIICYDTVNLQANLNSVLPAQCTTSINNFCSVSSQTVEIGTQNGVNSGTSYPAPFGNWYRNARHQFIFLANELNNMLVNGTKITEIAWETTSQNAATNLFNAFTINMGCTNESAFPLSNFSYIQNLSTVFSPQNIPVTTGWNTFQLTNAYEWDGVSNLVVEICYDNLSSIWTNNWSTPYTTTSFPSVAYFRSDNTYACTSNSVTGYSNNRPVTRFTSCDIQPDPNDFTYQWYVNNQLDTNTSFNPSIILYDTSLIKVICTNTNGGCTDSSTLYIDVFCNTCSKPLPTLNNPSCSYSNDGSVDVTMLGNFGPWTIDLIDTGTGTTLSSVNNSTNHQFNNLSSGIYQIVSTDTTGCSNDTIIELISPPLFNVSTISSYTICNGDSVLLQSSGASQYAWSSNYNISDTTISNPFVWPNVDTIYQLIGYNANNCTDTTIVSIQVNSLPNIFLSNDTSICLGDSISIISGGGVSYFWLNTDNISDVTVSNPMVWPSNDTTFQVLVTGSNNCIDTGEIAISVYTLPIVDAGINQVGCFGDSFTLSSSGNAILYIWNNGIIDGAPFPLNSTQSFILTGNDINGCENKDTVLVTVHPLPNIDAGNNQSLCLEDSIVLNASNGDSYTWLPNYNIDNENTYNPIIYPEVDTTYIVTGIDTNGCTNIDSVQITIDALPTITTSNDTSLCIGDSITISANGGVSYLWLTTDSIDQTTINNPSIWPANNTIYQVLVTGSNNCSDTGTISITVNSLPNIDAGINMDICFGDTAQLSASGGV